MTDELQPCPFCGGEVNLLPYVSGGKEYGFLIQCPNVDCQAEGPFDLGKSGAIEKWNTRVNYDGLSAAAINLLSANETRRDIEDKWIASGKSDDEWDLCMEETQDAEAMIIARENELRAALQKAEARHD